jgi:hypothetical protein
LVLESDDVDQILDMLIGRMINTKPHSDLTHEQVPG